MDPLNISLVRAGVGIRDYRRALQIEVDVRGYGHGGELCGVCGARDEWNIDPAAAFDLNSLFC